MQKLLGGLQKTKKGKSKRMRDVHGKMSTSAEEDAEIFAAHFKTLYGRKPQYDLSVLTKILQRDVRFDLDGEPTREDIIKAVKSLKLSGPGCSGVSAAEWKALLVDPECVEWVEAYVMKFWRTKVSPREWDDGELKILEKKGDLSDPNNYRGIMLLEVAMKVIAYILKVRLVAISETLPHEMQNGFRPGRGTSDGTFNVRLVLRKLKEHGQSCWLLLLDFIKAFDRVPRELLWPLMAKLGVPPALISVLQALHATVNVKFAVEGVTRTVGSIIGVKQGDLLGPILFNFHVAGAMMAWQQERQSVPPVFQTKEDCVLDGREWRKEVNSESLEVADTLYADDTGEFFKTRADAVQDVPLLVKFLAKFGLFVHVKLPGQKKSKSVLMYHSAPRASYRDFSTFDGECFDDIDVGGGSSIHVEPSAPYLGSLLTSDGKDDEDVALRIRKASGMFGSLQACLFKQKGFSNETKVAVYNSLVLSVLLYGSESWALTQRLRDKLRSFHRRCVRSMCRVNMWHVQEYHITAQALEQRLGISSFETYLVRRRLRWLGHVRRMPWHRLPRKLLTSWVSSPRMACGQEMTYGRSILEDLRLAEEAGMVFPEAAEEVDAGVDELEVLSTAQLREKGKELGVVPVGDKRKTEVWKCGLRAARGAVQQAAAAAAAAVAVAHASAASATATAAAAAELRKRGRVRKLAPSDGWQTAPAAVARRVVEDGQEDAAADEAVVLEEDLSEEEADSAGPVKWVVPAWEVLAADRGGWRAGLKGLRVNESEVDVC